MPLSSLLSDGRRGASGRAAWNGTPGLTVKDEKSAKQPQNPLVISCCKWSSQREVVIVVAHFHCAHTWLRPADFPCVFSEFCLTARLSLSQPTAYFIALLRLRLTKATWPACSKALRQTSLNFPVKWFLFHFQWFRWSPLAILETWHEGGGWAESSSRKHEGNFSFFLALLQVCAEWVASVV